MSRPVPTTADASMADLRYMSNSFNCCKGKESFEPFIIRYGYLKIALI